MKFLIAGFGSIGRRHLRNLRALGETDIVLLRTHHSTLPDDEIIGLPVETSLPAALAHRPDAVIISNPTALHLDVALPAAEAGCHILMEKPISHSLDRVDLLEAALQRGGGKLLVGFQFRFHPGLRQIQAWLANGAIGRPYTFRAHWGEYLPNWHPWEDYRQSYAARPDLGGGVILTLTHPLDYLRWLLGDVTGLWASAGTLGDLGISVVDSAEIGLQFKTRLNGSASHPVEGSASPLRRTPGVPHPVEGSASHPVEGTLHLDFLQRPATHTLEIAGTLGTIRWDSALGNARLYQAETSEWLEVPPPPGFDRNDLFLDELRHFLRVMQNQEQPLCSLADGAWALRLALAAHQSAGSGLRVTFSASHPVEGVEG